MKVVAICSSPRKKANSTLLAKSFLEGAKENGAEVELIKVANLKIKPCKACCACKKEQKKGCEIDDDMKAVYKSIASADVIAFAAPVYFARMNGPMYNLIDRMYGLLGPQGSRIASGKKAVSFFTCGSGPEEVMVQMHKDLMASMRYFGMVCCGKVLARDLSEPGEIEKKYPEKLAEAKELAKKLTA